MPPVAGAFFRAFLRAGALRFVFERFVVARREEAAARFFERFAVFFFAGFFFDFFRAMHLSFNTPHAESSARGVNGQFARTFQTSVEWRAS